MSNEPYSSTDRVAELRRAFDQSFAEAPSPHAIALENLLHVRLGDMPYALRLAEMSGLFVDLDITPVPALVSELLGLAGIRGSLVPVYDLRAILGHRPDTKARWLVLAANAAVGFAFDRFEGHARVPLDAIVPQSSAERGRLHVREVLRAGGVVRPIVSIRSVLEAVTNRVHAVAPEKE